MGDPLKRVAIVGSGNWGSTIAKIVGNNIEKFNTFENEVRMYVYEEMVDGRKLTEIINQEHENVKYLPGHKFSPNVVAYPDVIEAVKDADILLFILPHQFVERTCLAIKSHVKSTAFAVSFSKGFYVGKDKHVDLLSSVISRSLEIPCYVLMGANIATEVAAGTFCEATVGSRNYEHGQLVKGLIQTDEFRIVIKPDTEVIEVLGALKNIVAVAAGFSDGLGYGDNTKAAVIRLGLKEMVKFCEEFFPGHHPQIFLESCGVADLVTTCYGGRNRKVAAAFVKTGKDIRTLEEEMLNGQKLQGPDAAAEVQEWLKEKGQANKFPLFAAVHDICERRMDPKALIDALRYHPEFW
ncbi:unnamed protein product [Adineta ricciae]|uniref:Glycerol-3-phosphate dehydrogenase [NAD(+)] n=1 Tax=Adineta ricciae TaxID=249248 RepID=A0A814IZ08_ADIRI|nr:unnamed protein product [Adineta ricciae]CAF1197411.1 unnamed protein product [Adineta ricciae]